MHKPLTGGIIMATALAAGAAANPFGFVYEGAITENKPGEVNVRPVRYRTGNGVAIAANLYLPAGWSEDDARRWPAVTVAHPNGGVKEQVAGLYAQRLAEAGFLALAADAACQGESGGEPRLRDWPENRIEDVSSMVDFLATLPQVDAARIGSLGICGGGGYTVAAAQRDKRIRAVAAVSPFNSGRVRRNGFLDADPAGAAARLERAAAARNAALAGAEPSIEGFLPSRDPDVLRERMAALPRGLYRDGIEYYGITHAHPRSSGSYTTESFQKLVAFDVEDRMDLLTQPLLVAAGTDADTKYMADAIVEKAVNAASRELFAVEGATHIETYWKHPFVDQIGDRLAAFFAENLGAAAAPESPAPAAAERP